MESSFQHVSGVAERPPSGAQAIERAAALLVRLVETSEPWRLTDLAAAEGLPKSTTSRLLRALERHDLVQRDPRSGSLRPGAVLVHYARRGTALPDLIGLAQPALDRLGRATGETVNLAVPTPAGVEQIAQVDSRFVVGATNWVGYRVPYHASAVGKVFLAFGAVPMPSGPLERLAPATITDPAVLVGQLEQIRERGFASIVDELELGLTAVAAPIRGAAGAVVAAVAVSGPSLRVAPADVAELGALIKQETAELSARLGHRGA